MSRRSQTQYHWKFLSNWKDSIVTLPQLSAAAAWFIRCITIFNFNWVWWYITYFSD